MIIADYLEKQASIGGSVGFNFIEDEAKTIELSYSALYQKSLALAARLAASSVAKERVLLLCPQDQTYLIGLFACWQAGAVAVPSLLPRRPRHLARLLSILRDCTPRLALVSAKDLEWIKTKAPDLYRACTWLGRQSGRSQQRVDRAEWTGTGGRDPAGTETSRRGPSRYRVYRSARNRHATRRSNRV